MRCLITLFASMYKFELAEVDLVVLGEVGFEGVRQSFSENRHKLLLLIFPRAL